MEKEVKLIYSELWYELHSYYMQATWEDRGKDEFPAYDILGKEVNRVLNSGSKTMYFTKDEASTFLETLENVAHDFSFDCMHPSTKRGYKIMLKKLKEQL